MFTEALKSLDLHLCKHTSLFIANGQIMQGKRTGKATTKHDTILDYMIGNLPVLANLDNFEISEFDPLSLMCTANWISLVMSNSELSEPENHVEQSNYDESADYISEYRSVVKPREWDNTKRQTFHNNVKINEIMS